MHISTTGRHLVAEMYGLEAPVLRDKAYLISVVEWALRQGGFTILDKVSHSFPTHGKGVTAAFLLSESHATFHTYPEWGSMSVDVFSCGTPDPRYAFRLLVKSLNPDKVTRSVATRYFRLPKSCSYQQDGRAESEASGKRKGRTDLADWCDTAPHGIPTPGSVRVRKNRSPR